MLFVEFAGLPGSGKTTVARELERRLSREGIRCLTRSEIAADDASVLVRHIRRAWLILGQTPRGAGNYVRAARFIAARGQTRPAAAIKVLWNLCTVIAIITGHRRKGNAVVILDQGLAQGVWSVGIGARDGAAGIGAWQDLLAAVGTHDVGFVLLGVPPAVARRRLAERPAHTSRMQGKAWAAAPERWRRAQDLYRCLAAGLPELAASRRAAACLELDSAAGDPGTLAAEIQARLFPKTLLQEPDDAVSAKAGDLLQHELERCELPLGPHRRAEGTRL